MPELKRLTGRIRVLPRFRDRLYLTNTNMQACSHLAGASKRCCFLCETYIQTVKSVKVRGFSGKAFPWAMPPWGTVRDIHKRMYTCLIGTGIGEVSYG